jgi:hypothetical protein
VWVCRDANDRSLHPLPSYYLKELHFFPRRQQLIVLFKNQALYEVQETIGVHAVMISTGDHQLIHIGGECFAPRFEFVCPCGNEGVRCHRNRSGCQEQRA